MTRVAKVTKVRKVLTAPKEKKATKVHKVTKARRVSMVPKARKV